MRPTPSTRGSLITVACAAFGIAWPADRCHPAAPAAFVDRCGDCHGGTDPAGGFDIGPLLENGGRSGDWRKVRRRIESGEMPPPDEPPLRRDDRIAMLTWVEGRLTAAAGPPDPGPPLVRRLSRDEYVRTIRDLVGLDFDAAAVAGIADDSQGHGFANRADVLGLSPALMEKYFTAADAVLGRVLAGRPRPVAPPRDRPRGDLSVRYRCAGPKPDDNQIRATMRIANAGTAAVPMSELTLRYWFTSEGQDDFQRWCDYAAVEARNVSLAVHRLPEPVAGADACLEVTFTTGVLPPGGDSGDIQVRIAAADWSPFDQSGDHSFDPRAETLVEAPRITLSRGGKTIWGEEPLGPPAAAGAAEPPGPDATLAWQRIFAVLPGRGVAARTAAARVIGAFAARAWRRRVSADEIGPLLAIWQRASAEGADFDEAVRPALTAVLVSPHFLFRVERDDPPTTAARFRRVDDHELAVRLSYFLWSSMPDDELLELAGRGRLSADGEWRRQARRMLADPRAEALTTSFGAPWLQLGKLATARPTPEFFPEFTPALRLAMLGEATAFFDHLRRADASLLDLIDCDYTFVNEELARHYRLAGVAGPAFRRIELRPEDHRGGLLGMAAVLTATSHTFRTSPTLRGKYVLDVLLGDPPAPPPANAGVLDGERRDAPAAGFREQLVRHAGDPACAACHSRIDPLGFGLETYDGIGRWRNAATEGIDASGRLPDGRGFEGPAQLKAELMRRKSRFLQTASAQALAFALGRRLEECDDPAVDAITAAVERDGGRFSTLVLEVVGSFPFQHRRNIGAGPAEATSEPPP